MFHISLFFFFFSISFLKSLHKLIKCFGNYICYIWNIYQSNYCPPRDTVLIPYIKHHSMFLPFHHHYSLMINRNTLLKLPCTITSQLDPNRRSILSHPIYNVELQSTTTTPLPLPKTTLQRHFAQIFEPSANTSQ